MKIQIVSDLHLEFQDVPIRNEGADILILSGDICIADYFRRSEASPKYIQAQRFAEFFYQCSQEFDEVFYVLGNHEHYHGKFEQTAQIMRDILPNNVHLLDNEIYDYGGFRFVGGTLWTYCSDLSTERQIESSLNDFKLIKICEPSYRRFRMFDTYKQHNKLKSIIDFQAERHDNLIVIGHHAPSYNSITQEYRTNKWSHLNPAYYTDLDEFIGWRSDSIKLWTHGHVHSSHDYYIGDTRIIANPHGYGNENPDFRPGLIVEV